MSVKLIDAMSEVAMALSKCPVYSRVRAPIGVTNPSAMVEQLTSGMGALYFKFDQGFGQNATIHIELSLARRERYASPRVEVNWNMTTYSPSGAVVAAKLHSQVAELACLIQAILEDEKIENPLWLEGIEDPAK